MNPSPALDHLGGAALVYLTKTKPREHDLMSFVPCLQKNRLHGAMKENLAAMSIRDSGKSRSLAQTILADSYLSTKRGMP